MPLSLQPLSDLRFILAIFPFAKTVIIDGDGRKFCYADLRRASFALSAPIKKHTRGDENIGIFLPTGAGAIIAFLSIHAAGRVPAMLNFTAGIKNLKAAAHTAPFDTIITAHKFIEIAGLQKLVEQLSEFATILYLEDLQKEIGVGAKLRAVLGPVCPGLFVPKNAPDDSGVILFTSGTEGNPKGVVLTHSNILANVEQIEQHVELEDDDIIFNPLPTFHCYGLTAGTLWPLYSGRKVVLHPSPLQTKTIAKRIFKTRATVIFATDTFLQQYMRASKDGGLNSLRIAVCGAERVREETRKTAEQRFDMEVLGHYVIRGRIKRFAKIGGEMVSLMVVENCASAVWPDAMLILMTEQVGANRGELLTWAQTHGVPEISVPKKIITVDKIPVLGTGKLDYVSITNLAKEAVAK